MNEQEQPSSTEDRVLRRISVAPPYFGLTELTEIGDGIVNATVPPHPTLAPEAGPIEAAQVARHLAILGSCAVALSRDDDDRHHYLATKAHYTRMANAPASVDGPLRAQAIGSWVDRRTARAFVTLTTDDGRALNLLDVEYTVLAPRMFRRFNPPVDLDELKTAVAAADPTESVERTGAGVRVDAGLIPIEMCAGHFPDYPAAPVAIVMGKLCRAAGMAAIDHLAPNDPTHTGEAVAALVDPESHRYRIEEGHVTATGLARAGQHLVLEAEHVKPVRGGHQMQGRALADGEVVGEVDVVLSVHGPALQAACSGVEDDIYRDALVDIEMEGATS